LILINKNIQKSKRGRGPNKGKEAQGELEGQEGEENKEEENSKNELFSVYSDDEESSEYEDLESDDEPFRLENIQEFTERKNAKKKLTRHQIQEINKMIKISDREKRIFEAIDEFLEIFQKNFPLFSQEQILDILQKNSFNLENSYLELIDSKNFESKIFFILKIFILSFFFLFRK